MTGDRPTRDDAGSSTRRGRRAFLRAAGLAALAGAAGCASVEPPTGSAGTTDDRTATPTDAGPDLATHADATFRGGLRNQGYYPEASVPDAVAVEWTLPGINTGDHTAAKSSAVLAPDGNLVWPGDTGEVRSVARDGTVNWTAATDVRPQDRGIHGTPTVANDTVYVGAYDGAMYAFDLATGEREWKQDLGDAIGSSPVYYDGTLYIAVEYVPPEGAVFGLDAATGEVTWNTRYPTDHPHSTIAIDRDAGKLVVGSNDGNLYAWEFPSGEYAWTFETGDAIKGPVATHDGGAYFGSWDERVYCVGLDAGDQRWAFPTDHLVMSGPSIDTDRGVVYVGSHDENLYAIDAATGDRRWAFDAEGWIIGCPVVTSDAVLVGSYADALWAVDRESGEAVWRVDTDGWVTATPLVVGDNVYVAERRDEDVEGSGKGFALEPE
jgi:outer membrane protein assembly factor BamB